tara:strand:+ start:1367 stop:1804 length:438 start_codon:yes stop_codon:yes gene_type:complete
MTIQDEIKNQELIKAFLEKNKKTVILTRKEYEIFENKEDVIIRLRPSLEEVQEDEFLIPFVSKNVDLDEKVPLLKLNISRPRLILFKAFFLNRKIKVNNKLSLSLNEVEKIFNSYKDSWDKYRYKEPARKWISLYKIMAKTLSCK